MNPLHISEGSRKLGTHPNFRTEEKDDVDQGAETKRDETHDRRCPSGAHVVEH